VVTRRNAKQPVSLERMTKSPLSVLEFARNENEAGSTCTAWVPWGVRVAPDVQLTLSTDRETLTLWVGFIRARV
jgi:hypothetical protein